MNPCVALLDEPTSALDASQKAELLNVIRDVGSDTPDIAMVIVTHDYDFAFAVCTELVVMNNGIVAGFGSTASLTSRPPNRTVARLLNQHALVDGFFQEQKFVSNGGSLTFATQFNYNGPCIAAIRADEILMTRPDSTTFVEFTGRVASVSMARSVTRIIVQNGDIVLTCDIMLGSSTNVQIGDKMTLYVPTERVTLLPADEHL
jgi:ABC-type sulfate/molybdate transport systems ATPase subunit